MMCERWMIIIRDSIVYYDVTFNIWEYMYIYLWDILNLYDGKGKFDLIYDNWNRKFDMANLMMECERISGNEEWME